MFHFRDRSTVATSGTDLESLYIKDQYGSGLKWREGRRFEEAGVAEVVNWSELPLDSGWRGFVNSGDGPLRQVDNHVKDRFITEWLGET